MAIDQFALIQGARQAEADNMARARFDVEQAIRQDALARGRQAWDLAYPQAQMSAEQNMAQTAALQKAAVDSMNALAQSRAAAMGQQGPVQTGVDTTAQMMQKLRAGGQSLAQPFNALGNQSLDTTQQPFDALAGQSVVPTQQYQQGVVPTQQAGPTDLQRVQGVPNTPAALVAQIQNPGTDPRVAAGAQAFQQSMGQTLNQYRPGNSALVDALTMRANLDAQAGLAQKYFGNDRVAAAMAANTGVGTALTAPEEQQRARNIASLNLQAPGALESLGATRDMNGTYINYNGMVFGSDADFKTYMVNRAMAGANGAVDSLKTEAAAGKANLDLNVMRNLADIMIANAQVPNIEFHRGVNGNYIAVPKVGATPEQVAQGNAVAAQVNEAAAAAAATNVTPAAEPTTAPAAPAAPAGVAPTEYVTTQLGSREGNPILPPGAAVAAPIQGVLSPYTNPALVGVTPQNMSMLERLRAGVGGADSTRMVGEGVIPTAAGVEAQRLSDQLRSLPVLNPVTSTPDDYRRYNQLRDDLTTRVALANASVQAEQRRVADILYGLQRARAATPDAHLTLDPNAFAPGDVQNPAVVAALDRLNRGLPSTATARSINGF